MGAGEPVVRPSATHSLLSATGGAGDFCPHLPVLMAEAWEAVCGPCGPRGASGLPHGHLAPPAAGVKFRVLEHEAGRPLRLLMQVRPLCTPHAATRGLTRHPPAVVMPTSGGSWGLIPLCPPGCRAAGAAELMGGTQGEAHLRGLRAL